MKHFTYILLLFITNSLYSQSIIKGSVFDHSTGEALSFVTIYNTVTNAGTETNELGQFSLEADLAADSIQVSFVGYDKITLPASETLNIGLKRANLSLNEIVVTASREEAKRTDAPVSISAISSRTIEENKPTTIDQVLNQTAGVNMVDLGNEQHSMSIRRPIDFGASYLYLEDGIPIRTSGVYNHNALLEINMANTSRVEIIRGPASSMYGSEAIGGAVNFISKKPAVRPTAYVSLQGNDVGYKRADFSASNTFNRKLGVAVSGYYADQKNGIIEHSDFHKLALNFSANYAINDNTSLTWNNTYVDYYSDMSGSLDSVKFFEKNYASRQTFTHRKADIFRTKLAFKHSWNDYSKTTLTGYYRNNSMKQNPSYRVKDDYKPWLKKGNPNLAHGEVNDNSFQSIGFIGQHKQDFDIMNGSFVAGASVDISPNTYKANYIRINKSDAGIYDTFEKTDSLLADYKADLLNTAVYGQLSIEPIERLKVMIAARYDRFHYTFDNNLGPNAYTSVQDGDNTFSRITPKIGLTYNLLNNSGIYANYSQGFVPPQVSELYRGNDIPTLKPVYYENYEVGGWLLFANGNAKLEASIYQMDGQNEIISVLLDDGSRVRQNAGKTRHRGIEYSLNIFPHKDVNFRFGGTNAAHTFVEFNEAGKDFTGNRMPQAPEWIFNTQVTYKPSFVAGLRASIEWQHIDGYFMDQANTKSYDGHNVFNLRLGYLFKQFDMWSNVMNVTNTLYSTVARSSRWGDSYSLGRPRSFTIGVGYKFQK